MWYLGGEDGHIVWELPEIQFEISIDEDCHPDEAMLQRLRASLMCSVCIIDD
jgi:hypothetical protein